MLHSFTGYSSTGYSDGSFPTTGLIFDNQGALYGTTLQGGSRDAGTVFNLTPPAKGQITWTATVLYNFTGYSDGGDPASGLIFDNQGALYGTTQFGGITACGGFACGTVFKLTPPAKGQQTWTEAVLHSFTGGSDGGDPTAGLIFDNQGALYGTTLQGGSSNGGTVFKLTPPAKGQTTWTKTVLYSFCSLSSCSDGLRPVACLIFDKQGALYSITIQNGSGDYGTVFKLTPPAKGHIAWTETVLHRFKGGSDGGDPQAGLIFDKEGALYSTTSLGGSSACGGSGCGTVFKLTTR